MQEEFSQETAGAEDSSVDEKLVPVAESIRYRKRAQSAEKKIEQLSEQLAAAQTQTAKLSEQLSDIQAERQLMRKLSAAGSIDLEAAMLLARNRMQADAQTDVDEAIEQLQKEKPYLFGSGVTAATPIKTAGVKTRSTDVHTILASAAKKAATSGSRADLQEYLKLRRNYL